MEVMKFKKSSFLLPSRFPSNCSRLVRPGMGTVPRQFPINPCSAAWIHSIILTGNQPSSSKNSALLLPRLTNPAGGGPIKAIISARWARVEYPFLSGSRPENRVLPWNKSHIYLKLSIQLILRGHELQLTITPTFHMSIL